MLHQNDTVKTMDQPNMSKSYKPVQLNTHYMGRSLTLMLLTIGLSAPGLAHSADSCPVTQNQINPTLAGSDYRQWGYKDNVYNVIQNAKIDVTGNPDISDVGLKIDGHVTKNANVQQFYGYSAEKVWQLDNGAFYFSQSFKTEPSPGNYSNTATFNFNKSVGNFALTIYDIDGSSTPLGFRENWRDKVELIARDANGNRITPRFSFANSDIVQIDRNTVAARATGQWGDRYFFNEQCEDFDYEQRCRVKAYFDGDVKSLQVVFTNDIGRGDRTNQEIMLSFDKFCPESAPTLKIEKDDGLTEVEENSITDYVIKVKNQSNSTVSNATLSDPNVTGLRKLSNIQCDSSVTNNACVTPPTVNQLESGFPLPTLRQGQTYAITVPTQVTARSGSSITNTATIQHNSKTINATDTNSVTTPFAPPIDPTPAICPPNHQMYYLGDNPPSNASNHMSYNWVNGTTEKTYTFTGSNNNRTNLTLSFLDIIEADDYQPNGFGYQKVPFYVRNFDITTGAINLAHKSRGKKTNHKLQVMIDKPVSKFGFVIQDLDSTGNTNGGRSGRVQYIEEVDVSESGGTLDYNPYFHTINAARNVVTSKDIVNCRRYGGGSACPINATWGYKPSNTPFMLKHNNAETNYGNIQHVVGYSDFYFCVAPPKVVINKVLNGQRVNDTDDNSRDQFKISIADTNNTYSKEFITEGSADSIAPGKDTSGTLTLKPNSTYTIAETIINGSANDYTTTYECSNTTTSSATNLPQSGKGKSFSLSNLNYGDEIVCTITNTPVEGPAPKITLRKDLSNGVAKPGDRFTFDLYSTSIGQTQTQIEQTKTQTQQTQSNSIRKLVTGSTASDENNGVYDIFSYSIEDSNFTRNTYTIVEGAHSYTDAQLSDYSTSYSCIDNNKPNSAPLFSGNGNQITLTGLKRAQDIICTFTNTPNAYTFSGIIFNDNGGISSRDEDANDIGRTYTDNPYYFNGQYDPDHGEHGISVADGENLKVQLVNCKNNNPLPNQKFTLNANGEAGRYSITIAKNQLSSGEVCLLQTEPNSWQDPSNDNAYSVDTTANKIKLNISNNKNHYPDNDFGEVKQINAALVLTKRQFVNPNCIKNLTSIRTDDNNKPEVSFSKQPADKLVPNQCMAYQLEAFNRGHINLTNIKVKDTLQKKGVDGSQITLKFDVDVAPKADPKPDLAITSNTVDEHGRQIVEVEQFDLPKNNRQRRIYFNTKYSDK